MSAATSKGSKTATARSAAGNEKNYKLYAIEYHSAALHSIRDEYADCVRGGLRRCMFIIDLDAELQKRPSATAPQATRQTQQRRSIAKGPNSPLLSATLEAIARCRATYDEIERKIASEENFDLFTYWLNNLNVQSAVANNDRTAAAKPRASQTAKGAKGGGGGGAAAARRTINKMATTMRKSMAALDATSTFGCPALLARQHNRTGQPPLLGKRKYISDEPLNSKLFIILTGSHLSQQFYLDLLSHGEPLQAITHFLTEPCAYDLLLPHTERHVELMLALQQLHTTTHEMRKQPLTKPVGIFQQRLPVISRCAAQRLSAEIYAQLSWWHYDLDVLRRHYEDYYVQPFHIRNVAMPAVGVDLHQLYETAASLGMQGQYLTLPLPAVASDIANIVVYLDSLLSTFGEPSNVLTAFELEVLATPPSRSTYGLHDAVLRKFAQSYSCSFDSITHLKKVRRLVVERTNSLLRQLIAYSDLQQFRNVYLTCLEYNLLRNYLICPYAPHEELTFKRYERKQKGSGIPLPPFVQFYATHECVLQRLNELLCDYDRVEVTEVRPSYRLYHFQRQHNEIHENQKLMVLPSRLCFRDFTVFQLDEFLTDLVTPEMLQEEREARWASLQENLNGNFGFAGALQEDNCFIRLYSLKARKLQAALDLSSVGGAPGKRDSRSGGVGGKHVNTRATQAQQQHEESKLKAGLPPHHPLLEGYNLEDIRQEIGVKRSKYHFDEGMVEFYEEFWCFTQTNQNLIVRLYNTELNIARSKKAHSAATARNLLLRTPRDVSVRIFGGAHECAKVLINYPNGLSIYHHNNYAEQIWNTAESVQQEHKRVFTPHGAVIVYYKADDMILIMRYNGEVYRLYQYEFPMGEEEEEALVEDLNEGVDSVDDATRSLSTVKTSEKLKGNRKRRSTKTKSAAAAAAAGDAGGLRFSSSGGDAATFDTSQTSLRTQLLESIASELRYLQLLMDEYDLSYLHLIVTTTQGHRINLTHKGRAYISPTLQLVEWHDYFANESYAMRSDDVKMIWTALELKCYHADGTVLCTGTHESLLQPYDDAELDKLISASSSHLNVPVSSSSSSGMIINMLEKGAVRISRARRSTMKHLKGHTLDRNGEQLDEFGEGEGEETEDASYVLFVCGCCSMQHANYATVRVRQWHDCRNELKIAVDLCAADGVKVEMHMPHDEDDEEHESQQDDEIQSLRCIRVSIGCALELCVTDVACNINVNLKRYGDGEEVTTMCERFQLCVNFAIDLSRNFHTLVDAISKFKNYREPKSQEIFFMEHIKPNCKAQGFEFLPTLKPPPRFSYAAGNTRTDFNELQAMNNVFRNMMPWYDCDMKKFPRFQKRRYRRRMPLADIPMILDVTIFCKVPRLMRGSNQISKFMEPFEQISFKKTRHQIKEALDHYRRPQIELIVRKLRSRKNWKCKLEAHQRRLFTEQQRKGLYYAMLRYKVYPKYHQFMEDFRGQAKHIEFFDFMSYRCRDKNYELLPQPVPERSTTTKSVLFI